MPQVKCQHTRLSWRRVLVIPGLAGLVPMIAGCGLSQSVATSAGADAIQGLITSVQRQSDPELVRQGLPSVLLLIDGLLISSPDDPELLLSATNAYVSYCQAFLSAEDETERAIKLYDRARDYGLRLLRGRPFFDEAWDGSFEEYLAALEQFTVDDVPHMHATAAAWLGWIIAGADSMEALAELPRALALTERVLALDESYGSGSSHLVFAVFFTVQPRGAGQDLERARRHFERAIELAGPENLLPRVLYAEHYGKATLDEEFFVNTLKGVVEVDVTQYPEHRLANEIARQRAGELLSRKGEIF